VTFFTLQVRRFPQGLTPETWETASTQSELLRDLHGSLLRIGPYQVGDWAQARGLKIYDIDNCWIRVPVEQGDLDAFGIEILKGEFDLTNLVTDNAKPSTVIALEVEEF
jgi:hypothetical protein